MVNVERIRRRKTLKSLHGEGESELSRLKKSIPPPLRLPKELTVEAKSPKSFPRTLVFHGPECISDAAKQGRVLVPSMGMVGRPQTMMKTQHPSPKKIVRDQKQLVPMKNKMMKTITKVDGRCSDEFTLPCGIPEIDNQILISGSIIHHLHHRIVSNVVNCETAYFICSKKSLSLHSAEARYFLTEAPGYLVDKDNCFKLDDTSLVQVSGGRDCEVIPMKTYVYEASAYFKLKRIKMFSMGVYHAWRIFYTLKSIIVLQRNYSVCDSLKNSLFILDSSLSGVLLSCKQLCHSIASNVLVAVPTTSLGLSDFESLQHIKRSEFKNTLRNQTARIFNILREGCRTYLETTMFDRLSIQFLLEAKDLCGDKAEYSAASEKPGLDRLTQRAMQHSKTIPAGDHVHSCKNNKLTSDQYILSFAELGAIHSHIQKLRRITKLIDYFILESLVKSLVRSGIIFASTLSDMLKVSQRPSKTDVRFHVALQISAVGTLEIEPPPPQFINLVNQLRSIQELAETVPSMVRSMVFEGNTNNKSNISDEPPLLEGTNWGLFDIVSAHEGYTEIPGNVSESLSTGIGEIEVWKNGFITLKERYLSCKELVHEDAKVNIASGVQSPEQLSAELDSLQTLTDEVQQLPDSVTVSLFVVDLVVLKQAVLPAVEFNICFYCETLPSIACDTCENVTAKIASVSSKLKEQPISAEEYKTAVQTGLDIQRNHSNLQQTFETAISLSAVTDRVLDMQESNNTTPIHQSTPFKRMTFSWKAYQQLYSQIDSQRDDHLSRYSILFEKIKFDLLKDLTKIRQDASNPNLESPSSDKDYIINDTEQLLNKLHVIQEILTSYNDFHRDIGIAVSEIPELESVVEEVSVWNKMWILFKNLTDITTKWRQADCRNLDSKKMGQDLYRFAKSVQNITEKIGTTQVTQAMDSIIEQSQLMLPIAAALSSRGLKHTHMLLLDDLLLISISKGEIVTLDDLYSTTVHHKLNEVLAIARDAEAESSIRESFDQQQKIWQDEEIQLVYWQETEYQVISNLPTLLLTLNDSYLQLSAMTSLKAELQISKPANILKDTISKMIDTAHGIMSLQALWIKFEPFFGCPDLQRALDLGRAFIDFDKGFRDLVRITSQTGFNAMATLTSQGLADKIKRKLEMAEVMNQKLSLFLQQRRSVFPRYCLVDDAQLLDLLASHNKYPNMQPILTLLGNFVDMTLVVDASDHLNHVTEITGCSGEAIELKKTVRLRSNADTWLQGVCNSVNDTISLLISFGFSEYAEQETQLTFIETLPTQVATLIYRIYKESDWQASHQEGNPKSFYSDLQAEKQDFIAYMRNGDHLSYVCTTIKNLLMVQSDWCSYEMNKRIQGGLYPRFAYTYSSEQVRLSLEYETIPSDSTASVVYGNEFVSNRRLPQMMSNANSFLFSKILLGMASPGIETLLSLGCQMSPIQTSVIEDMASLVGKHSAIIGGSNTTQSIARQLVGCAACGWISIVTDGMETIPDLKLRNSIEVISDILCREDIESRIQLQQIGSLCDVEIQTANWTSNGLIVMCGLPVGSSERSLGISKELQNKFRHVHIIPSSNSSTVFHDVKFSDLKEMILAHCYANLIENPKTVSGSLASLVSECWLMWEGTDPSPVDLSLKIIETFESYKCIPSSDNLSILSVAEMIIRNLASSLGVDEQRINATISKYITDTDPCPQLVKSGPPVLFLPIINTALLAASFRNPLLFVGSPGSGKTPTIRYVVQQMSGTKYTVVPSAVSSKEFFGSEGLFVSLLRKCVSNYQKDNTTSKNDDNTNSQLKDHKITQRDSPRLGSDNKNTKQSFIVFDADPNSNWTPPLLRSIQQKSTAASETDTGAGNVDWSHPLCSSSLQFVFECRSLCKAIPSLLTSVCCLNFGKIALVPHEAILWHLQAFLKSRDNVHLPEDASNIIYKVVTNMSSIAEHAGQQSLTNDWQCFPVSLRFLMDNIAYLFAWEIVGSDSAIAKGESITASLIEEILFYCIVWGIGSGCHPTGKERLSTVIRDFTVKVIGRCPMPPGTLFRADKSFVLPLSITDIRTNDLTSTTCTAMKLIASGRSIVITSQYPLSGKSFRLHTIASSVCSADDTLIAATSCMTLRSSQSQNNYSIHSTLYSSLRQSHSKSCKLLAVIENVNLPLTPEAIFDSECIRETIILKCDRDKSNQWWETKNVKSAVFITTSKILKERGTVEPLLPYCAVICIDNDLYKITSALISEIISAELSRSPIASVRGFSESLIGGITDIMSSVQSSPVTTPVAFLRSAQGLCTVCKVFGIPAVKEQLVRILLSFLNLEITHKIDSKRKREMFKRLTVVSLQNRTHITVNNNSDFELLPNLYTTNDIRNQLESVSAPVDNISDELLQDVILTVKGIIAKGGVIVDVTSIEEGRQIAFLASRVSGYGFVDVSDPDECSSLINKSVEQVIAYRHSVVIFDPFISSHSVALLTHGLLQTVTPAGLLDRSFSLRDQSVGFKFIFINVLTAPIDPSIMIAISPYTSRIRSESECFDTLTDDDSEESCDK